MRIISLFFLLNIFSCCTLFAQPGFAYAKGIAGIGQATAEGIAVDQFDNVYTGGIIRGGIDFDPDTGSFSLSGYINGSGYVSKYDNIGRLVWAFVLKNSHPVIVKDVKTDSQGDLIVVGAYYDTLDFDPGPGVYNLMHSQSSCTFIVKYSNSGSLIWAKQFVGKSGVGINSIVLDNNDNIYTWGAFGGQIDFDPDTSTVYNLTSVTSDHYICKLDSSGNFVWVKSFEGIYNTEIKINQAADLFVVGALYDTMDIDPGPDTAYLIPVDTTNFFIAKFDSSGNFHWAKQIQAPRIGNIGVDQTSNIFIAGTFSDTLDLDPGNGTFYIAPTSSYSTYIIKLDSTGNFIWGKSFVGYSAGANILTDSHGQPIILGAFQFNVDFDTDSINTFIISGDGNYDSYICKLDTAGNFLWVKTINGPGEQGSGILTLNSSGKIFVAGGYLDTTYCDSFILLSPDSNNFDTYIAKLDEALTNISKQQIKSDFMIYPNPANNYFTITFLKEQNYTLLELYDIKGNLVFENYLYNGKYFMIITENISVGIYFLRVLSKDLVQTNKIIIGK